jgi:hypothetical protein
VDRVKKLLGWLRTALDVVSPIASAVSAVAALVIVVYTIHEDRNDDLEAARKDIVATVYEMGRYDAEGGLRKQHEIEALAIEVQQKIAEFTQGQLHLDPRLYRLMAEYVAYSTTDIGLAETFAQDVITVSTGDSSEVVFAHRVLGGVAAERGDPSVVESEFAQALDINARSQGLASRTRSQIDTFTKAFALVTAYLGAQNAGSPEVRAEFCALAGRWGEYVTYVADHERNDRLDGQLRRLDARSADDLRGICEVGGSPVAAAP